MCVKQPRYSNFTLQASYLLIWDKQTPLKSIGVNYMSLWTSNTIISVFILYLFKFVFIFITAVVMLGDNTLQ